MFCVVVGRAAIVDEPVTASDSDQVVLFQEKRAWVAEDPVLGSGIDPGRSPSSLLGQAQTDEFEDPWMPVGAENAANRRMIFKAVLVTLGVGAVLVALVLVWNRRLSAELAERRRTELELRDTNAKLQETNEERELFMHMAAHDLNGPLTTIAMGCELIAMTIPRSLGEAHEGIAHIRSGVKRMRALTRSFLSAEAIERGLERLEFEDLELSGIVGDVVARYERSAMVKGVHVDYRCTAGADSRMEFPIRGDATAMDQVVDNLLSNAVKFSPSGSEVGVFLSRPDGSVRLEIVDRGPGILPEEMPRLFTKFVRLSARPTAGESSMGLGLAIVKRLVDAQLGAIRCQSRNGDGTRFIVEFPEIIYSGKSSAGVS
jgi:signal transduction histidine kinase